MTSACLACESLSILADQLVHRNILRFLPLFLGSQHSFHILFSLLVAQILSILQGEVKIAQSCLTLWDPMDCIVHEILQARILEWVAFPFSRGSSQPSDWTQVSHTAGRFFTSWVTRKAVHPSKIGSKVQNSWVIFLMSQILALFPKLHNNYYFP